MSGKTPLMAVLVLVAVAPPLSALGRKKPPQRAMLEKMEAVPCGSKEKGVMGVGAVWASVGITKINSNEKLCPQHLVRTDEMEYQIRATDKNHPVTLPVGHEIEYKIKKDRMFVKVPDGDKKPRNYQVVSMIPANSGNQDAGSER
jgi:hypothetical protein